MLGSAAQAIEPRFGAAPGAGDGDFAVGAQFDRAFEPRGIGDEASGIGEAVLMERNQRALGADVKGWK